MVIYEPKGKAREYSPLACNLYLTCSHNCKYCYAPKTLKRDKNAYFTKKPEPRKNIIQKLANELKKNAPTKQVLLSFIGDVYSESSDNNETTRKALELFLNYHVPVAILSKGGKRCLKDVDLFQEFGDHFQFGSTLTFMEENKSIEWENGAALPEERLQVLKKLHNSGIKTFASFEPVIEPSESLQLIQETLHDDSVDTYKIGKINNFMDIDKTIDWRKFLEDCLFNLEGTGKNIYIKYDLRKAAGIQLEDKYTDPDLYTVKGW